MDLRATKGSNLPAPAKNALDILLTGITDADEQKKKIEHWFDDSMDAVSGWYKRKANAWLWVISAAVCLVLNADTISISKVLWDDPTARAAVVQSASEYVNKKAHAQDAPAAQGTPQTAADLEKDARANLEAVKNARTALNGLSIPLGWCRAADESGKADSSCTPERQWPFSGSRLLKILGILITVLAVSQGAGDPPPDSRQQQPS